MTTIKVSLATPDGRKTALVDDNTSIKDVLNNNGVVYTKATLMLDGVILGAADINKTLAQMNVTSDCTISVTIKMDNAA
jgi:hypothetical protein